MKPGGLLRCIGNEIERKSSQPCEVGLYCHTCVHKTFARLTRAKFESETYAKIVFLTLYSYPGLAPG